MKSCPGIGVKAAQWLIDKNPILLGADNWPVEVAPNPDPQLSLPVHQIALVVNGVHLLENMKLDELVAKQAYEFAFMMQPLEDPGRHRLDRLADRGAVSDSLSAHSRASGDPVLGQVLDARFRGHERRDLRRLRQHHALVGAQLHDAVLALRAIEMGREQHS